MFRNEYTQLKNALALLSISSASVAQAKVKDFFHLIIPFRSLSGLSAVHRADASSSLSLIAKESCCSPEISHDRSAASRNARSCSGMSQNAPKKQLSICRYKGSLTGKRTLISALCLAMAYAMGRKYACASVAGVEEMAHMPLQEGRYYCFYFNAHVPVSLPLSTNSGKLRWRRVLQAMHRVAGASGRGFNGLIICQAWAAVLAYTFYSHFTQVLLTRSKQRSSA